MSSDVFVYDAVRTPFGKYAGGLAGSRPDDLAALVIRAIVDRAPGLDPARVDEIVLGNANGAGGTTATSPGWPACSPDSPLRCQRRRSTGCAAPGRSRWVNPASSSPAEQSR